MSYKHNPGLTGFARELRKNMTDEERRLWYDFLRAYPVRFLRQKVIDQYIADFYCSKARLVIALDGSQHYEPDAMKSDMIRTSRMADRGLTVIHIPNIEINRNFRAVCEYIDNFVTNAVHPQD